MASQPTPPIVPPKQGFNSRHYLGKPMVNKPLIRPSFWAGALGRGRLTSHNFTSLLGQFQRFFLNFLPLLGEEMMEKLTSIVSIVFKWLSVQLPPKGLPVICWPKNGQKLHPSWMCLFVEGDSFFGSDLYHGAHHHH